MEILSSRMFEQLSNLDSININFSAQGQSVLNIVLAVVMFGVALGIKSKTFKEILKKPKSLVIGLLLQWVGLPALTFLLILLLKNHITPMVAMGMILVASCPGGNISNFMSSFGKGNTELSVSMTAVATLLATLITPINFAIWGGLYADIIAPMGASSDVPVLSIEFVDILKQVCILLGIPIVLGIAFSNYLPKITNKIAKPFQYLSLAFFVALVIIAFTQNWNIFIEHIGYVFIIVFIHNILALSLGNFGASAFKLHRRDKRSLTLEVGIQNSGLGLVLLFNPDIFPQVGIGGMLITTAWWGVWHIVAGLSISSFFRVQESRIQKCRSNNS